MLDLCRLILAIVIDLFRPRAAVEAEILQQIIVLRRGRPGRVPLLAVDRMVLGWVYQLFPKTREALAIVRPIPWCNGIAQVSAHEREVRRPCFRISSPYRS